MARQSQGSNGGDECVELVEGALSPGQGCSSVLHGLESNPESSLQTPQEACGGPAAQWIPKALRTSCGSNGKESACNAGDLGSITGSGRSAGEGKGYTTHSSILGLPWQQKQGIDIKRAANSQEGSHMSP